jgi:hypothetical protein
MFGAGGRVNSGTSGRLGDAVAMRAAGGAGTVGQWLHGAAPVAMFLFDGALGSILGLIVARSFAPGQSGFPVVFQVWHLAMLVAMGLASLSLVGAGVTGLFTTFRRTRIPCRMQWAATLFLTLLAGLSYLEMYVRALAGFGMAIGMIKAIAFAVLALISFSFAVWSSFWGSKE